VGVVLLQFLVVAALGATSVAPLVTLAVLLGAASFGFALYGVGGLTKEIGRKLPSAVDWDSPWRAHLRGSVILATSFLVPILGWFLVLPIAIVTGAGAAALSVIFRRPPDDIAPAPEPKASAAPEPVEALQ
jgi:hypothetical protein